MFYLACLFAIVATLAGWSARGPRFAMWAGMLAAILVPVSLTREIRSAHLYAKTSAAVLGLVLMATQPGILRIARWRLSDGMIGMIIVAQTLSQIAVNDFRPLTIPELLRVWLLPYLCGRFLLVKLEETTQLLGPFAWFALVLSASTIFESLTRVNPFSWIGGSAGDLGQIRMGLKRASGPLGHPIYLGNVLVLFYPFALEAARLSSRRSWKRVLPWLMAAAVCCTMSRGPMIAVILTVYIYWFFAWKRSRWTLALGGIATVAIALGAAQTLGRVADEIANEHRAEDETRIINVNGEEYVYTGTSHRWLQFLVFGEYVRNAGWFGYGQGMMGIEIDEELQRYFFSIDCHYLLNHLKHGWAGTAAFGLLMLGVLTDLARVAWKGRDPASRLAGGLFGAILALALALFTVWLQPGFGWVLAMLMGFAANLRECSLVRERGPGFTGNSSVAANGRVETGVRARARVRRGTRRRA